MCLPIDFAKAHPEYIAKDNSLGFMSTDNGNSYNLCHCKSRLYCIIKFLTCSYLVWSNFEIADMDFWRGPAYTAFFDYLDRQGGFYYEVRACHACSDLIPSSFAYIALGRRTSALDSCSALRSA